MSIGRNCTIFSFHFSLSKLRINIKIENKTKTKQHAHKIKLKHSRKNRVSNGALAYAITGVSTNTSRPLDELSSESNLQMLPQSTLTTTAVIQRTKLVFIFILHSCFFFFWFYCLQQKTKVCFFLR